MTPTLFHLHFNTPDVAGAADRLGRAGVPLQRRFGSLRGVCLLILARECPMNSD